jgi:protein TonB
MSVMGITSNSKEAFNEMLFENRNKSYGAYAIRKNYERRMVISMFMTVSLFAAAMIIPSFFKGVKEVVTTITAHEPKIINIVDPNKPNLDPPVQHTAPPVKKGLTGGTPTPVDSTVIVKNDSITMDPHLIGDPKGTDTTRTIAINIPTGGGGGGVLPPKAPITVPDVNPEFPGGMAAFYDFLKKNIKYPRLAVENEIKGTIYISFVVDENGKVSDIQNMNALGGGLEKEAVRVAGLMPDWKPGILNGEKVPVKYNIPVKFALR